MKRMQIVCAALLAAALLGTSVPLAFAGGAAGQDVPGHTTACRLVQQSSRAPYVVNIISNLGNQENVQVGPLALVCDDATLHVVSGPSLTTVVTPTVTTCYVVGAASKDRVPGAEVTDAFGTHTGALGGFQLICLDAQ